MASHPLVISAVEPLVNNVFLIPLLLIVAALASNTLYNLYFHPLHSYPGPFLGRATVFYSLFWEFNGTLHLKSREWHDKYGEVVRVAPNQLSYNSSRAWETICGHRTNATKSLFDKDPMFFPESPKGPLNIVGANGEHHRRLRRLLAHAFSEKALKAQELLLQRYVDFFVSQLQERSSVEDGVVNMVHWFNFTTFDIIGDLAFGESFELLEKGIWQRYLSAIFGTVKFGVYYRAIRRACPPSMVKFFDKIVTPSSVTEDRQYLFDVAENKLASRTSIETERQDFVYHMLKGSKEALGTDGLSFDDMLAQSQVLLIAGSETTATALSGMLYYLLEESPQCLSRLLDEIRTSFDNESDITFHSTTKLKYLQAVLEETLRIYPPVPSLLPRVTPKPGQVICDRFVSAGTSVGMHHYSAYHSAENFFDPDVFHPERWLEGEDSRFINDNKSAFHPFSHGPRNCLGKNLAYAELRLITCKFFWNFDVESQPQNKNWKDQYASTLWEKKPLLVKLHPRTVA